MTLPASGQPQSQPPQTLAQEYFDDAPTAPSAPSVSPPEPAASRPSQPRDAAGRFLPPEAQATLPEPPKPSHDALVQLAIDLGIPAEQARKTPSEILSAGIRGAFAARNDILRATDRSLGAQSAPATGAEPSPQSLVATLPGATAADDVDFGKDEDGNPYEGQMIPSLVKIIKDTRKELKELKSAFEQLKTIEIQRQSESLGQRVDRQFKQYEQFLGKGRGVSMDKNSAEYKRRLAVLNLVEQDKSNATLEDKIDRAVSVLYPQASPPASPPASTGAEGRAAPERPAPALSPEQQAWNDAALRRPTQRTIPEEPKGTKRAERSVGQLLAAMETVGGDYQNGVVDSEDFLP